MTKENETHDLLLAWEYVADTVMGGVSTGGLQIETYNGRNATVLRGNVSLDNNGGFVQIAADLNADGSFHDASEWDGFELTVSGNKAGYECRLRTDALTRPMRQVSLTAI